MSDAVALKLVAESQEFPDRHQTLFQTLRTDVAAVQALRSQFDAFKNQIALGDLSDLDPLSKYRLAKDLYNQALVEMPRCRCCHFGCATIPGRVEDGFQFGISTPCDRLFAGDGVADSTSISMRGFPISSAASSARPSVTGKAGGPTTRESTVTVCFRRDSRS